MIIVSDTTPIISLMKAGQLKLRQKLFGVVLLRNLTRLDARESEAIILADEIEFASWNCTSTTLRK